MKLKITWDTGIGLGIILFAIFILINALGMPNSSLGLGPGDFPEIISVGLIICGIILLIQGIREKPRKIYSKEALISIFILIASGLLYVYLVKYIGFLYLTPFLMLLTMYLFGYRKIHYAILISIIFTLMVYYIFYGIFKVPLPSFSLF